MALNVKKIQSSSSGPKQENLEPGNYPARLIQVIDLGVQKQRDFKGEAKPPIQEVRLVYELSDAFMVDESGEEMLDKPRWVGEDIPLNALSKDKAKSTNRYLAIDPKCEFEGDFTQLVGRPVVVTIVNNQSGDKVFDNIAGASVMRPRDADKLAPLVNEAVVFDLSEPDMNVFNKLPKWIQEKITSNLEFAGSPLAGLLSKGASKAVSKPKREPVTEEVNDEDVPY